MNASLDGLLTGLSLIVAIGAQNAYVLRQGLSKRRGNRWPPAGNWVLSGLLVQPEHLG